MRYMKQDLIIICLRCTRVTNNTVNGKKYKKFFVAKKIIAKINCVT